jgi:hypothetical protein
MPADLAYSLHSHELQQCTGTFKVSSHVAACWTPALCCSRAMKHTSGAEGSAAWGRDADTWRGQDEGGAASGRRQRQTHGCTAATNEQQEFFSMLGSLQPLVSG